MSNRQGNGLPRPGETALGFGFVTAEDRAKWDQARQYQRQKQPSAAKEFLTSAMRALTRVQREVGKARMQAMYRAQAEHENDMVLTIARPQRRTVGDVEAGMAGTPERDSRSRLDEGPGF
ncbi:MULTISPECIES: hypothetical protein [Arthrobacter]|uniref:Uncharacterized protein n=1 Tax=Arthrobacter terricola TaxID=2547396 RepID=A0A4R5K7T7_9MICC|nr:MULTISPECIES: hypothetical protein [Arthrobacter]MBT8163342.1 hypothetical protein [Arthrobacter sp. GN70]TDF90564.1 hypothetical protein E1809_22155 [Arthrobacter terricola]